MTKPIKKFRNGRVTAAVWENTYKDTAGERTVNTVTIAKSYTDTKGKWHNTDTIAVSEIPKAISVLEAVYRFLVVKEEGAD